MLVTYALINTGLALKLEIESMKKILSVPFAILLTLGFSTPVHAATLHIHHSSLASWKLDCDVITDKDHIKQVKNLKIKSSLGSISNRIINYPDSKTANIKFTRHVVTLTYRNNVKINLRKGKLYVTAS